LIRLQVSDTHGSVHALFNLATREGISVDSMETGRPTLEEAFVELTGLPTDRIRAEKGGAQK
jgi:hypothetical protein